MNDILKNIATKATAKATANDPYELRDMTEAEKNAKTKADLIEFMEQDLKIRGTLAKILRCPAAWRYLMPEILKRIQ
jgi:DNA-binding GntR family transcriptional regulator